MYDLHDNRDDHFGYLYHKFGAPGRSFDEYDIFEENVKWVYVDDNGDRDSVIPVTAAVRLKVIRP